MSTEPRTRRSRAFWQHHVKQWQTKGGPQSDYCRQHQISERLFSIWKNKFAKEITPQDDVAFIPVVTEDKRHTLATLPAVEAKAISIHLPNGISVEASLPSSGQSLSDLIQSLVPIPC